MRTTLTILLVLTFATSAAASPPTACTVDPNPFSPSTSPTWTLTAPGLAPDRWYEVSVNRQQLDVWRADDTGLVQQTVLTEQYVPLFTLQPGAADVDVRSAYDHDAGTPKNVPGTAGSSRCAFDVIP